MYSHKKHSFLSLCKQKFEELQRRLGGTGSIQTITQDASAGQTSPPTPGIAPGGPPELTVVSWGQTSTFDCSLKKEKAAQLQEHIENTTSHCFNMAVFEGS